jgi:hypothetical protein
MGEFTVPPDEWQGVVGVKFEDRGRAAVMYSPLSEPPPTIPVGDDGQFYVRFYSWWDDDEMPIERRHKLFRSLMGKRVRVTIAVIDP